MRYYRRLLTMLIMLLWLCASTMQGQQRQKFSIASFGLDSFGLFVEAEGRPDLNEREYALLKVTSNSPDDNLREYRFRFGQMKSEVDPRDHGDELWVYVQRNAKLITIERSGYATINNHDLGLTIQAGKTYTMRLSSQGPKVYTQMVLFSVSPADSKAVITVKPAGGNGQEELLGTVDAAGQKAKNLPYGQYTYRVMAENYYTSEGMLTLSNQQQTHEEKVTLRPRYSMMTLTVDADADIFVNGEKKGRRSWTGPLNAGSYQVECRQASHRPSQQTITVEENKPGSVTLPKPTPITGMLSVISEPLGATISIDGRDYGQTPKNITDLLVGSHQLKLSKAGYNDEILTVEVKEHELAEASVNMSNLPKAKPDPLGLCPDDQHPHKIDLGIGILFACCNVGAKSPTDYGDYFAWGETTPKSTYNWSTYKWCKGSADNMTKYCTKSKYGIKDNKTQLELSDDAARANWGGTWRMPTIDELKKLVSKCKWTWTAVNGVNGYKVTAKNGNSIFLPVAGGHNGTDLNNAGFYGDYWSSSLNESRPSRGRDLSLGSSGHSTYYSERYLGESVRPVSEP